MKETPVGTTKVSEKDVKANTPKDFKPKGMKADITKRLSRRGFKVSEPTAVGASRG